MSRKNAFRLFALICIGLTTGCKPNPPTPSPTKSATIPNPASAYCVEQGYIVEIVTAEDGSQSGVCRFPDGSSCDEWAYFREECGPSGQDLPQPSATEIAVSTPDMAADEQGWQAYRDPIYGFEMRLPPDWKIEEADASDALLAGHLLNLHPVDNQRLENIRMTFRRSGEETLLFPTGVGQGEFVPQGTLDIAGQPVQRVLLVCPSGEITAIWYHQAADQAAIQLGDLEFGLVFSAAPTHCQPGYSLDEAARQPGELILGSLLPPATPIPEDTTAGNGTGQLVFSSNRNGLYDELYLMNLDGTGLTLLAQADGNLFAGPWSPDEQKILYTGFGPLHSYVGVIQADGRGQTDLSQQPDSDEGFPAWSPDGRQIVFTSRRDGNNEVYRMEADGSNPVRLTEMPGDDFAPAWSPDGQQIAFVSDRDSSPGVYSLYLMAADGSKVQRIAALDGSTYTPAWSPNGQQIAVRVDRAGQSDIYVVSADGHTLYNLTNGQGANWSPAWSPDGLQIAFQSNRDGNWEIYLVNKDGSNPRNLTQSPADDTLPFLQP